MSVLTDFILMSAMLIGFLMMLIGSLNLLLIVADKAITRLFTMAGLTEAFMAFVWKRFADRRARCRNASESNPTSPTEGRS